MAAAEIMVPEYTFPGGVVLVSETMAYDNDSFCKDRVRKRGVVHVKVDEAGSGKACYQLGEFVLEQPMLSRVEFVVSSFDHGDECDECTAGPGTTCAHVRAVVQPADGVRRCSDIAVFYGPEAIDRARRELESAECDLSVARKVLPTEPP